MLLSNRQLAVIRASVTGGLSDSCAIYRDGAVVASTVCRVSDDKGQTRVEGGARYDGLRRFKVILPWDAQVQYADQLHALGSVYAATIVQDPISLATCTLVQSYQLFDAAGNPTYMKPNAVISTKRQSGSTFSTPLNHVATCRIELPKLSVEHRDGPVSEGKIYCLPGTDIARNDLLTIHSCTNFPDINFLDIGDIVIQGVNGEPGALPEIYAVWKGRE